MNDEKRPQQVPANAGGNLRETHDDESALHSDWGSDESIHESLGDGRPREAIDEHQGDPRTGGGGAHAVAYEAGSSSVLALEDVDPRVVPTLIFNGRDH